MTDYSLELLTAISSLVYRNFGICIPPGKFSRLELKLERMMQQEGVQGLDDLYALLISGNQECMNKLVRYITTCHTYFFREPEHFRLLVSSMRHRPQKRYLIWCAACSTGEEPYSITMTLLDEGIQNFHIIASDLNKKVLEQFNRGVYHENRLAQMPPVTRLRYFTRSGESYYTINHTLRDYISIKNLNLMDTLRFPEQFDYVFCRNVLIYFDERSRRRTVDMLVRNLKIGGSLFIGHAEVLLWQPENLKKLASSVYRRLF